MILPILQKFVLSLLPMKLFSQQARKPSGFLGVFIMTPMFKRGNAALNQWVETLLTLQSSDRVLEIGFGPGFLIKQMVKHVPEGSIDGIDFSETMLKEAKSLNREHIKSKKVFLKKGNCKKLPYPDKSFDKICTSNTIYFWESPEQNLKEIYRVCKKNGKLVLGFRTKAQMERFGLDEKVFSLYTEKDIRNLVKKAGFQEVRIKRNDGIPLDSYCAIAVK